MNDTVKVDDSNSYNERSLKKLLRSLRLSQGHFSLILVRCNYKRLQQRMMEQLREQSSIEMQEITLSALVKTLYTTLYVKTRSLSCGSSNSVAALSIFGLEDVVAIDELLTSTNQVRDEFRKNLSFPLILWITDEIAAKLIHLAPDFKSWAAATIKFEQSASELIEFLKQQTDSIFAQATKSIASSERPSSQPGELEQWQKQKKASHFPSLPLNDAEFDAAIAEDRRRELKSAWKDLCSQGQTLEPCLEASLQFVLGRDSYARDQLDIAIEHYKQSLALWQQALKERGISEVGSRRPKHSSQHSRGDGRNRVSAAPLRERLKLHSPPATTVPESAQVSSANSDSQIPSDQIRVRQATVFFQMALCYRLQAVRNPVSTPYWQQAKSCLEQSQALFEQAGRPDLLAGAVTHLGEVLQRLEAWEELQTLAETSLELHFTYGTPCQLAHDYGFLAEVALHRNRWGEAHQLAQLALEILKQDRADPGSKSLYLLLLAQSLRQMGQLTPALDYLKLAQAHSNAKYDPRLYIDILVELRSLYFERGEYLMAFRIQEKQREIEHQYRFRAFIGAQGLQPKQQALNPDVPLNRVATEAIAEEIMVSCRQEDIKRLLERMSRDDHKLTIVHGRSGVGKSSLVNGGLVPALKHFTVGARQTLPVVVRIYIDWAAELEKGLIQGLGQGSFGDRTADSLDLATASTPDCCQTDAIIGLLRLAADRNLLVVLIFDQFEEFFFAANTWAERQPFYDCLQACLNLPYIKILLSLREDYLHYLLEFDFLAQYPLSTGNRLSTLDAINNILDKQIRYQLRDFSVRDAREVIRCLTERAQFYLEPALIEAVVADLAGDLQEVRPIELQVVGAQLQEEGITTAAQYQQLGAHPKTELVKRSLERVISDCGPENEDTAWKILFSLTDERGVRLSKTQHELGLAIGQYPEGRSYRPLPKQSALSHLWPQRKKIKNSGQQAEASLDLILEILVGHGLAFLVRETPEDRYQLVHDYLVGPIRQRFGLEARLYQAEADKKISQEQLYRTNQMLRRLLAFSVVGVMLLMSSTIAAVNFWRRTIAQKQLVVAQRQQAEIHTLTAASEALFLSNQQFDALMESLRAGRQWRQLKQSGATSDETEVLIAAALQQAVYGVKERNRLEGHGDVVWGVSFSPDGSSIASASVDKTVKLWRPDGRLLTTLRGHRDSVASVSWSADSQVLASGSLDKTVKLWRRDGRLLATLTGHGDRVTSVSFSPNGLMLASASKDKTVKLWSRQGELVRTLVNQASVNWVSFSPDGSMIAAATDGGTVELWRSDGRLLGILAHSDRHRPSKIYTVCFSPNGELLATGGADNQVKLWSLSGLKAIAAKSGIVAKHGSFPFNPQGDFVSAVGVFNQGVQLLETLNGHSKWILNASFSPDGKTLASTSADNTVKVWDVSQLSGGEHFFASEVTGGATLLGTLAGHGDQVTQVSWSSDGKMLASSSYDKTVRLWNLNEVRIKMLEGHGDKVLGVNFSPEGRWLASASMDKTVKLWSRSGLLLDTLAGHAQRVTSVSFSPDGQLLASGSYDKTVKLWSLKARGSRELTLRGHADSVMSVSFSPDGQLIASASKDKTVKLWSREGKLIQTLIGHRGWVNSVSFNPDGRLLVSASDDGTVKVWNLTSVYAQISSLPARGVVKSEDFLLKTIDAHKNFVLGVSFSPDGRLIASASYDNTLKLWSLTPVNDRLDFSSEMTAGMDFQVRLHRTADFQFAIDSRAKKEGSLLATLLKGASDSVTSVSFSPDGQLIASGSYDHTVKLWNRQGVLLRTLRGHHDSVMGVSFSPDGKVLASASRDKTVILWNLDLDDLLVRGCDWVSDYLKANPNVSDRDRHLCDGVLPPGGDGPDGEKRLSLPSPSPSLGVK